jgi:hypothetical protein
MVYGKLHAIMLTKPVYTFLSLRVVKKTTPAEIPSVSKSRAGRDMAAGSGRLGPMAGSPRVQRHTPPGHIDVSHNDIIGS